MIYIECQKEFYIVPPGHHTQILLTSYESHTSLSDKLQTPYTDLSDKLKISYTKLSDNLWKLGQ